MRKTLIATGTAVLALGLGTVGASAAYADVNVDAEHLADHVRVIDGPVDVLHGGVANDLHVHDVSVLEALGGILNDLDLAS
jgi:hypothetical protein